MALPEPTVIQRFRHFQTANSLASYLRESGINAHLLPPNQIGQYGEGPVHDVLYDVFAVGCTNDEIQRLKDAWIAERKHLAASTALFCYHCGDVLDTPLASCPGCGKALDLSATSPTSDGE